MPKLKDFIKKNYVLCTVFAVILIVCIASLIIIHLINSFSPHVDVKNEDGAYFQIVGNKKYSFDATLKKENNVNKELNAKNYQLTLLSPIYYSEEKKIMLPSDSVIVLYMNGFKGYKLPQYSEIIYTLENNAVIVNGSKYVTNDYFVYDANGNYIFMDSVTLKYNGKTIKLSPLSFVNASQVGLTYYDYENDKIVDENIDIKNAFIVYDTFNIDLLKSVVIKNGNVTILKNNVNAFAIYKED